MKKAIFSVILVALFLVACSAPKTTMPQAVPTDTDKPVAPTEPSAPVVAEGNTAVAPESGTDKALGPVDKVTALKVDEVLCDKAARKISFRFENIDEQKRTWNLDQALGWQVPKDQVNVKVFVNSYEANNPNGYTKDGERLFGPEKKFSANCGGVVNLEYGQAVTCTLYPVSLKSANDLVQGNNEIMISALPSSKHIIQFLCE